MEGKREGAEGGAPHLSLRALRGGLLLFAAAEDSAEGLVLALQLADRELRLGRRAPQLLHLRGGGRTGLPQL